MKILPYEKQSKPTEGSGTDLTEVALTDWENEPKLADLKNDLTGALPHHNAQIAKINRWLDNLNVTGSAVIEKVKGRSNHVPKLIRKQAEWKYPSLSAPFLSTDDLFDIKPVTAEDKKGAEQNSLVLNHQVNARLGKRKFIGEYVRTAYDEGTVVVRVGWDYQEAEVEEEVPVIREIPIQDPFRARTALEQTGSIIEQVQVGTELRKVTKTVVNQPSWEVCDFHNVIIDPTCKGDITKARFVIYMFETSISELEKSDIYDKNQLKKIDIESANILAASDSEVAGDSKGFNFKDEARKRILAYEYWGFWDIDGDRMTKPFVATWVGDVKIRMEENPFPGGFIPFVAEHYLVKRKSTHGEPDGELLEDNQKLVGAVTRGVIDLMGRSANSQQGVRADALDITNRRKFEKGQDYEFNAHVNPAEAFYMHQFPEVPASAYQFLAQQNQEAEALTGTKAFNEGISGQTYGDVAAGVRGALDASSKREVDVVGRLANGLEQIARMFVAMNQEFLDEKEVIRITNEEFVEVRKDDLAGKFDLSIGISTAEEDNAKAGELAFMLQTIGPNSDPEVTKMIQVEIAKLRKMPALAKKIEEYRPQPDPLEQQMKQLEIQKLQAEIQKLQSEAIENQAEAQLDSAKAQEAKAKSDLMDLDFVEQESGVKQARDMEQQGAQAKEQLRKSIIENAMKNQNKGTGSQ